MIVCFPWSLLIWLYLLLLKDAFLLLRFLHFLSFFLFSFYTVYSSILTFRFHAVYFFVHSKNCFFLIVAINSSKKDTLFAYNIFLLHPAHKDFIGIIPSSIPAFHTFHAGAHAEVFFIFIRFSCVCNLSILHPARKDFISIHSSISVFSHFILVSIAEIIFHFHGSHE